MRRTPSHPPPLVTPPCPARSDDGCPAGGDGSSPGADVLQESGIPIHDLIMEGKGYPIAAGGCKRIKLAGVLSSPEGDDLRRDAGLYVKWPFGNQAWAARVSLTSMAM